MAHYTLNVWIRLLTIANKIDDLLSTLVMFVRFILYRLYRFHWLKLRFLVMAAERGLQEIWEGFTNEEEEMVLQHIHV